MWPWAWLRHGVLWVNTWLLLAGGLGRIDADGTAVVCLEPPTLGHGKRLLVAIGAVMAGGAGAVWVLANLWAPAAAVALVGLVPVPVRYCWWSWRDRTVQARLKESEPAAGWLVCNYSADPRHPGAGRRLLDAVCAGADRAGRVLYLDTVVPRLVEYYTELGFEERCSAEAVYAGEPVTVTRMVRPGRLTTDRAGPHPL